MVLTRELRLEEGLLEVTLLIILDIGFSLVMHLFPGLVVEEVLFMDQTFIVVGTLQEDMVVLVLGLLHLPLEILGMAPV